MPNMEHINPSGLIIGAGESGIFTRNIWRLSSRKGHDQEVLDFCIAMT
jgi:hypothetical protein